MDSDALEEAYSRTLCQEAKVTLLELQSSFELLDEAAWRWGVRMYGFLLHDYCDHLPFDENILRDHIVNTNRQPSKQTQAQKILTELGMNDEKEEGLWIKRFMYFLDKSSSKGTVHKDRRSFMKNERQTHIKYIKKELVKEIQFTSITLALALIEAGHIHDGTRVKNVLRVLPVEAEKFFLPKYNSI